jgi:hypothetical protein
VAYDFLPTAKGRAEVARRERALGLDGTKAVAIISDSIVVRGALQALLWAMPGPTTKAFVPGMHVDAVAWLARFARFELEAALACVEKGAAHVGLDLRTNVAAR